MKRSALLAAALLVIAAVSLYVFKKRASTGTAEKDPRNFAFKDTASLTKIFLADKEGNQSELERTKDGWMVNGKFKCRSEAILSLLEVIKHVEVKMPVVKEKKASVLRQLTSGAVKVELYAGDKLVKQYYVGYENDDYEGSFMLLTDPSSGKNFPDPYVCWIPGFMGFLQPRYIARENDWRDRVVINHTPMTMKKVELTFNDAMKDSSFTIDILSTTQFRLTDAKGRELQFSEPAMKQYLVYLQNVSYEALITGLNTKLQDSLSAAGPFAVMRITNRMNNTERYQFYRKTYTGKNNPDINFKYDYDPDRLYLNFDGGRQWALAQYYTFGKLLVGYRYFRPEASVKK